MVSNQTWTKNDPSTFQGNYICFSSKCCYHVMLWCILASACIMICPDEGSELHVLQHVATIRIFLVTSQSCRLHPKQKKQNNTYPIVAQVANGAIPLSDLFGVVIPLLTCKGEGQCYIFAIHLQVPCSIARSSLLFFFPASDCGINVLYLETPNVCRFGILEELWHFVLKNSFRWNPNIADQFRQDLVLMFFSG